MLRVRCVEMSDVTSPHTLIPHQIIRALFAAPPTAIQLDRLLVNIANTYSVEWIPEVARQDMYAHLQAQETLTNAHLPITHSVNDLSELLDTGVSSTMNLAQLRKLCAQGTFLAIFSCSVLSLNLC
jgi:hypothetical protein